MTDSRSRPLQVGDTIGFLGGGQLARMMAEEARRVGLRVVVLDPDPTGPAGVIADEVVPGAWSDADAAQAVAQKSQLVTLDTEHVPHSVLEVVAEKTRLRPGPDIMADIQDRLRQRAFLTRLGLPQTEYAQVDDVEGLRAAVAQLGCPCVLKTRRGGYDGRGQRLIRSGGEIDAAWADLGPQPLVLEAFVPFITEVSILLARDVFGDVAFYPLTENEHRNHVLHISVAPTDHPHAVQQSAEAIGRAIAEGLDYVGVLAVEMFVADDGSLLVNEIAPRTHNSGHWTRGGCEVDQFAQHVRTVAGYPVAAPAPRAAAAMLNLLGDLWRARGPDLTPVWSMPRAQVHLYGKAQARPGRKMGHVTVLDDSPAAARRKAEALYSALARRDA